MVGTSALKLVFMHIGKTAGTALRVMFQEALGEHSCSAPFAQSWMNAAEASYYDQYPIICGHMSRSDHLKWFQDRRVITLVRDPIDRGLSFLHYVRSLDPSSSQVALDASRMSLLDLIETPEAQRNLNNAMVHQLGGHLLDNCRDLPLLLEASKKTLREAAWVGRQDHFVEDLPSLERLIGARLIPQLQNVTPYRPFHGHDDPRVIARLSQLTQFDQVLWVWTNNALFQQDASQAVQLRA